MIPTLTTTKDFSGLYSQALKIYAKKCLQQIFPKINTYCAVKFTNLLAPTGALIVMMDRDISAAAAAQLFQILAFMPFYTVTSVTLSCLNSINAIDVTRC